VIFLFGCFSIGELPVEFIPNVASPQIVVTAGYPSGNAEFVEQSLTLRLEEILSDTPGVDYITSQSNAGSTAITLHLNPDASADTASLDIQNRIQKAKSSLPEQTQQQGVTISQTTETPISIYLITTTQGQYDSAYLSSLAKNQLQKQLQLIDGVGSVEIVPPRPIFEISVDPDLMRAYDLSITEVKQKIKSQNAPAPGGSVGASRVGDSATYNYPVLIENSGFIQTKEGFEEIVVKRLNSGAVLRIKDIGTVKYIASPDASIQSSNGQPGVIITINLASGGNAVAVGDQIEQRIHTFKSTLPVGINIVQFTDRKAFILDSISNVQNSLILAIILVILVLLLFLQNWRTLLIPTLAIPISIIGTFFFLNLFGLTLNFLTMTALILACGLVVDDAILVVQSVTANIQKGMSPIEAAQQSMNELFGAIVSTSLVLISLFLPVAFGSGPIANIYLRFAVTIIFSIALSTFNALTFSPMLSALLLRPGRLKPMPPWFTAFIGAGIGLLIGQCTQAIFGTISFAIFTALFAVIGLKLETVFKRFNQFYSWLESIYTSLLSSLLKRRRLVFASLGPLALATLLLFGFIPQGLIPQEDMGSLTGGFLLNPGASIAAYAPVSNQARNLLNQEKAKQGSGISDFGILNNGQISGFYVQLTPLEDRRKPDLTIENISAKLRTSLAALPTRYPPFINQEAMIPGFGPNNSISIALTDKSSGRYSIDEFFRINAAGFQLRPQRKPSIQSARTSFSASKPSYRIKIDRTLLGSLDLNYDEVVSTIADFSGSSNINQTSVEGGARDVVVISQAEERSTIDQLMNYAIKNSKGDFVTLKQVASHELISTPDSINHFNFNRSITYYIASSPSYSSGQAMKAAEETFKSLNLKDVGFQFTGLSRVEDKASGQMLGLFLMAALAVFLVLSAQYESYITSLAIVITVPITLLGSLILVQTRFMDINIFSQIGLLMLIGLAAKNSILVVEAADQRVSQGVEIVQAAAEAGRERLQPILMTSVASLAGFFPLGDCPKCGS
jgi:multidrug efflux pump subunit AcrB